MAKVRKTYARLTQVVYEFDQFELGDILKKHISQEYGDQVLDSNNWDFDWSYDSDDNNRLSIEVIQRRKEMVEGE